MILGKWQNEKFHNKLINLFKVTEKLLMITKLYKKLLTKIILI